MAMDPEERASAADVAARAVTVLRALGTRTLIEEAVLVHGRTLAARGDVEQGYRVLAELAGAGEPGIRIGAAQWRGRMALDLGRPDEAMEHFYAAIGAAEENVDPALKVDLAAACLGADRPSEAAEAAEDALAELQIAGDNEDEFFRGQFLLARAYRELGQRDTALEILDEVLAHCRAKGNTAGTGQMLSLISEILDEKDLDADAARAATAAAEAYRSSNMAHEELDHRRRAALSWHWAGEQDQSLATLTEIERAAEELLTDDDPGGRYLRALINFDGARILAASGRLDEAHDRVKAAVADFASVGAVPQAAMAGVLRGRLLADLGDPETAVDVLTTALIDIPETMRDERAQVEGLLAELRG
jgi:tetratricopeptide (TPR) repeat protein